MLTGIKVGKKVVCDTLDDGKSGVLDRNKTIRICISKDVVLIQRFPSALEMMLVSLVPKSKMQKRDTLGGDFEIGQQAYKRNRWECSSYSLPSPAALISTYDVLMMLYLSVLMMTQCDRVKDGERKYCLFVLSLFCNSAFKCWSWFAALTVFNASFLRCES